jgi:hypothetical protein
MSEGGLAELRQRKKELLLESDINRQILRVELCQVKLKALDWKRGLFKVRTAYNWLAPAAGIFFAVYGVRKKMHTRIAGAKHNGRGAGKAGYLNLLGPLGMLALRKAYGFWRHARKQNATA